MERKFNYKIDGNKVIGIKCKGRKYTTKAGESTLITVCVDKNLDLVPIHELENSCFKEIKAKKSNSLNINYVYYPLISTLYILSISINPEKKLVGLKAFVPTGVDENNEITTAKITSTLTSEQLEKIQENIKKYYKLK